LEVHTQENIMDKQSKYRKLGLLAVLLGTLALSGCSTMRLSSVDTLLKQAPQTNCIGDDKLYKQEGDKAVLNIEAYAKANQGKDPGDKLDGVLDCLIADLSGASDSLKIYRGYVALGLMAEYAAFNYTGKVGGSTDLNLQSYDGIQDDAMSTLARIDYADRLFRIGSGNQTVADTITAKELADSPALSKMNLLGYDDKHPNAEKLHRALAVLMVAGGAEKPTLQRAKSWLGTLISALTGSLANPDSLIDQGLKTVGKSLTLTAFGNAHLIDARRELTGMKTQSNRPSDADWNHWAEIIKASCTILASSTGATSHCTGGWLPAQPTPKPKPAGNQ
jgi:hypothetical protein